MAQDALGKRLQVGLIYFLPWSGLHVDNISIVESTHPCLLRASSISFGTLSILRVLKNSEEWTEELRIKDILVNDHLVFKKTVINIARKKELFTLDPWTAKLFDGRVQGSIIFQKNDQNAYSYQGDVYFSHILLQEVLVGTAFQNRVSSGFLQGTTHFAGIVGEPESLTGSGMLQLFDAQLKTADFFGSLSRFFPVKELHLLKLDEAKANFTFSSDSLRLDSAHLKSENMGLSTQGNISFKGDVDLEAQLLLSGKLATCLKTVLPLELASAISQTASCEIPFGIHGSLSHLKTNLLEKMLNHQIPSNIGGALQQLLNLKTR